jgi:hypothetical protein
VNTLSRPATESTALLPPFTASEGGDEPAGGRCIYVITLYACVARGKTRYVHCATTQPLLHTGLIQMRDTWGGGYATIELKKRNHGSVEEMFLLKIQLLFDVLAVAYNHCNSFDYKCNQPHPTNEQHEPV